MPYKTLKARKKYLKKNKKRFREYKKRYSAEHREEIKKYNFQYKSKHKAELKKKRKKYVLNNLEKIRKATKAWRFKNKEHLKNYEQEYAKKNQSAIKARHRIYHKKNKAKIKMYPSNSPANRMAIHRKFKYGLSHDQFLEKLKIQKKRCAICKRKFYTQCGAPCVDHDHDTNKVRDLLCQHCNRALGLFKEEIICFENAIQYLKKHKEQ
jgi:hypothetical protein